MCEPSPARQDRPNDVARAVELERRPGAAHLEPAELETYRRGGARLQADRMDGRRSRHTPSKT